MTTIDPSRRLAAALREQAAALRERSPAQKGASASGAQASRDAAQVLSQRLRAIAADDPHRRQKAVRLYLEAELVREFGAALLNDSAFAEMLDAVQQQMADDAQVAAAVDAVGALLVGGKAP